MHWPKHKLSSNGWYVLGLVAGLFTVADLIAYKEYGGKGIVTNLIVRFIVAVFDPLQLQESYRVSGWIIFSLGFIVYALPSLPFALAYDYMTHQGLFADRQTQPPPPAPGSQAAHPTISTYGLWRSGQYLVIHREAKLPDICVKTNRPAPGYQIQQVLEWSPGANNIEFIDDIRISSMILRMWRSSKQLKLMIPVTRSVYQRHCRIRWIARAFAFAMILICFVPGYFQVGILLTHLCALLFFLLGVMAIFCWIAGRSLVEVAHFENNCFWVKGTSFEYLQNFPVWPDKPARFI